MWIKITIILILISYKITAQTKELQKANKHFFNYNYKKAERIYQELYKKGEAPYYVTAQLGNFYRNISDSEKSINWYKKAIKYPEVKETIYLQLISELKKQKRYQEAEEYLKIYNSIKFKETSLKKPLIHTINQLYRDSLNFEIENLNINTPYSEIGPVIYKDKVVFASNRKQRKPVGRKDIRDGNDFFNLYIVKKEGNNQYAKPESFYSNLKTKLNDGPISFNKDYTISFITRNIKSKERNKTYLSVFINNYKNGKWQRKSKRLPLTQINYSIMHACISKRGDKLFYVSDMEGGYGGFDIYYSEIKEGFLGSPVNLGPKINTASNELFPFVSKEEILYYASDEIRSIGGLDIYMAVEEKGEYAQSFNLGYPINTPYDDFGIYFIDNELSGYFVSNRPGGKGKDDIYTFKQKSRVKYEKLSGVISSTEKENPINGAIVNILDGDEVVATSKTNQNGEFSFYYKSKDNLKVEIKKRFYETYQNYLQDEIAKQNGNHLEFYLQHY